MHRRADWKDVYPGYWDVCFGGVLGAGEAWDDAAHRELLEEAGIDAPLELLGQPSWEAPDARLNGRVYLARSDGPFTCPDGEVVEVATVPLRTLRDWLRDPRRVPRLRGPRCVPLPAAAERGRTGDHRWASRRRATPARAGSRAARRSGSSS